MSNSGRYSDCETCKFMNWRRENPICKSCDFGEFYEAKIRTSQPTDAELMDLYASMERDD